MPDPIAAAHPVAGKTPCYRASPVVEETPYYRVRRALEAQPSEDLAVPILARDLRELTRCLARARLRGGRYAALDFSPQVRDLVTRLDASRAVDGAKRVH